jgi:hypothetical protein
MRILFLNYTFPGPFQHLAALFGHRADTTTLFAAECGRRNFSLPGVQRVILSRPKGRNPKSKMPQSEDDRLEWDIAMAFQWGRMTASSLLKLKERGFVPDIIFSSATMGNSLFLHMVFPESFWIVQGDWYFARRNAGSAAGSQAGPKRTPSMWWRNNLQLRALCESNLMVTSTDWQRKQYPPDVAKNLHIVPLCVDTDFFAPVSREAFSLEGYDFSQADEIVTITGKGIDPSSFF